MRFFQLLDDRLGEIERIIQVGVFANRGQAGPRLQRLVAGDEFMDRISAAFSLVGELQLTAVDGNGLLGNGARLFRGGLRIVVGKRETGDAAKNHERAGERSHGKGPLGKERKMAKMPVAQTYVTIARRGPVQPAGADLA